MTNKPEIACWGSFYKGVMQDFGYNEEAARSAAELDFHEHTLSIEPMIRLSDYEALQAECEEELFCVRQHRDTHFGELMRAIEQVDAMKAECERWKRGSEIRDEQNQDLHSFIMELKAECEELRKDAERYRWLREQCGSSGLLTIAKVGAFELKAWSGDDPDAAIDAAMQGDQQ